MRTEICPLFLRLVSSRNLIPSWNAIIIVDDALILTGLLDVGTCSPENLNSLEFTDQQRTVHV